MSKHIIDSTRFRSSLTKVVQYARIEHNERAHPQSKMLQKQPNQVDPRALTRRFLEFDRQKGS